MSQFTQDPNEMHLQTAYKVKGKGTIGHDFFHRMDRLSWKSTQILITQALLWTVALQIDTARSFIFPQNKR